jgi:hypothetical protein
VLDKTWQAIDRVRDMVEARIEGGELDRVVERALASAASSSTDVPASSASSPAS